VSRAVAKVPRPTPAQAERRRDAVARMTRQGYAAWQIAAALDVSVHTVTGDRLQRKRELAGIVTRGRSQRNLPPDPEPVDWVSEPEPPARPYELTGPIHRVKGLHDYLRESNARNRFAFNMEEAEAAGDEQFVVGSQVALADTIAYLQDLLKIAQDSKAALAAKRPEARDDLRVTTIMPDLTDPTARRSLQLAKPLPPPGTGAIPGRMYGYIWTLWYAGYDLDSDDIITRIAARENNPNIARVRAALAEMKTVLGER
jgi:hypothetical protein